MPSRARQGWVSKSKKIEKRDAGIRANGMHVFGEKKESSRARGKEKKASRAFKSARPREKKLFV